MQDASDRGRSQRLRELFAIAVELDEGARAELLDGLRGADAALRDELRALLQAVPEDDFLAAPALSPTAGGDLTNALLREDARPDSDVCPVTIGPYEVLRELGRGGQATVLLARDRELDRLVAVKVLSTAAAPVASRVAERFRREALALASLDHPGLCTVYDTGVDANRPWIAMRYVDGRSLAEMLEADRQDSGGGLQLPTPTDRATDMVAARDDRRHPTTSSTQAASMRTVALVERVAAAAHEAHERGLVHRDIKPANVMVTPSGQPVLLDFGIAHAEEVGDASLLTRTGDMLGTPSYMAPEQIRCEHDRVDRRTDVYALGATLYECLTGVRPFQAPSREGLYNQILTVEPRPLRQLLPSAPRDLEVVLHKALDKDPERRYATALAFAEDLRRARRHEPIRARPISAFGALLRWARRRPAVAASLAFAAVALSAGLAISLMALHEANDAFAAEQRSLARTRAVALANAASEAIADDPSLGLLLARASHRLDPSGVALSALHAALARHSGRVVLQHDAKPNDSCFLPGGRVLTAADDSTARIWGIDGELLRTLPHAAPVMRCAVAPDGATIATVCGDGTLHLWQDDGEPLATVRAHDRPIRTLEFAPSGPAAVLTGSEDGTARLWSPAGERLAEYDHGSRLYVATFSPDSTHVLTASSYFASNDAPRGDHALTLWHRSGARRCRLEGHGEGVLAASFSPDGRTIASASEDGTARLWDLDGRLLRTLPHPGKVWSVAFQPRDGDLRVVTACLDGRLRIWDLAGRERNVVHAHDSSANVVRVTQDGRLLTASWDQTARLFDADGSLLQVFAGHTGGLNEDSARFSSDEKLVLTHNSDGTARLWETIPSDEPVFRGHRGGVSSAVFSKRGRHVLTASADSTVRLWSASGELLRTLRGHTEWVNRATFSPDERLIASASDDGTVRLWRTEDGEMIAELRGDTARGMHDPAFSPDGRLLACASSDGEVLVFDVTSRERVATLGELTARSCWFGEFSADGRWLVVPKNDFVTVYDVATWREHRRFQHAERVVHAAFSPDGLRVATACLDGVARIWPMTGGAPVECAGHFGMVRGVDFSPDGAVLATGSADATIRLWDGEGRELTTLRGHGGPVWGVTFSADGRRLVSASFDGTARCWIVDERELLSRVSERLARVGRRFSATELRRYGELLGSMR